MVTLRYAGSRLAQGVLVVLGAVIISFALINLSGNAVDALGTSLDPSTRAQLLSEYGLDRPLPERFGAYLVGAMHGDFGQSFRGTDSARGLVLNALPYTLLLVSISLVVACAVALPVALHSVLRRQSMADRLVRRGFMLMQGLPEFFIALLLVLVFAVNLGWLPSVGISGASSYVLPVIALSLPLLSTLTRLVRSQLLTVLGMDFVTALQARGISGGRIVLRHALRNALPPLITYLALQVGWLLGGTLIVEVVFGIPGIGQLAVSAAQQRDLNVVAAVVVIAASAYVVLNLVADLLVFMVDPRIRRPAA